MATLIETFQTAFEKGKEEFNKAVYLAECGSNAGIRKMNSNKADWLKYVIYLAELGLEVEKLLAEEAGTEQANQEASDKDCINELKNVIAKQNDTIAELQCKNKQLLSHFGVHLAPYILEVTKK